MEPVDQVFRKTGKKLGLGDVFEAGDISGKWAEIVGKQMAEKTAPIQIKEGVLLIRTPGSAWSHQLSLLKPDIICSLEKAGYQIRDIRFISREEVPPAQKKQKKIISGKPDHSSVPDDIKGDLRSAIASYLGVKRR